MQQRANLPDHARPLEKRRIAVALQGGGSHGAFTWGVLDRLLGEPSLEIVGISGTSAGAMNGGFWPMGCVEAEPRRRSWLYINIGKMSATCRDTGACGHWLRSARGTSTTILFTSGLTC